MNRILKLIPYVLLSLTSINCVETIISVRVFPDGRYQMEFASKGDSTDIFDSDFLHPAGMQWSSFANIQHQDDGDEPIYSLVSTAILEGAVSFSDPNSPVPLRYPVSLQKSEGLISTSYHFTQTFVGRKAYQKYPKFAKNLDVASHDSTHWIAEALLYITQQSMVDLQNSPQCRLNTNLFERIQNHFRGVFYRVNELNLFEDLTHRNTFIREAFSPFTGSLPDTYIESLYSAMDIYESELRVTAGLQDDEFVYQLILPGVITETNADSLSGDTLKWFFNLQQFINDDYTMTATSLMYSTKRIQLLVIIGALIILSVLILLVKNRKNHEIH